MVIDEIIADIEEIEKNAALYEEANFSSRVKAIDFIEFNVIERMEGLLLATEEPQELIELEQCAEKVRNQLKQVNNNLFRRLIEDIRVGVCRGATLKSEIDRYVGQDSSQADQQEEIGYDSLDVFINGLLLSGAAPTETKERESEMVAFQPTPARIIQELVEKASLTEKDVLYDLGSGLGQVPILVNLLTGAKAKGVEFEPSYCDYARACAADLDISPVEFINDDARKAEYADGTVFFMYTPFRGRMLQEVLDKLRGDTRGRAIRLFTYGPCTIDVSQEGWLRRVDDNGGDASKLGEFKSV